MDDGGGAPDVSGALDVGGAGADLDGGPLDARSAPDAALPDAALPDAALPSADLDGDGLDDALELKLAADHLPFLSLDPTDGCPRGALLFRARPHPADPSLVFIVYVHLYEKDCGASGHVGDDEVFAVTVDPAKPPPLGIVAMKAIAHQGAFPCEVVTACGRCPGQAACETAPGGAPVVYSSRNKHGSYVSLNRCATHLCFDSCTLAATPARPALLNAGEPARHLTEDLTASGLITAAAGWTEPSLLNFNPWDPKVTFGKAGKVASDLVDPAFDTAACR